MPQIINSFEQFIDASIKNPHAHFKVNKDNSLTVYNQEDKWTSRFGNVKTFLKSGLSADSVRAKNNWAVANWVNEKASAYRAAHPDSKLAYFGKHHVTSLKSGGEHFAGEELLQYMKAVYPNDSDVQLQARMQDSIRKLRITEIRVEACRKQWHANDKWGSYFASLGGNHTGSTSSITSLAALDTAQRGAIGGKYIFSDSLDEDLYADTIKVTEECMSPVEKGELKNIEETFETRVDYFAKKFTDHVQRIRDYKADSLYQKEFIEQLVEPFHDLNDAIAKIRTELETMHRESEFPSAHEALDTLQEKLEKALKTSYGSAHQTEIDGNTLQAIYDGYCLVEDFDTPIEGEWNFEDIETALENGHPFKFNQETNQYEYIIDRGSVPILLPSSGALVGNIPDHTISLEEALRLGKTKRSTVVCLKALAFVEDEFAIKKFERQTAEIVGSGDQAFNVFTKEVSILGIEQLLRGTWETIRAINHLAEPYRDKKGEITQPKLAKLLELFTARHATLNSAFDVKLEQVKKDHQYLLDQAGNEFLYNTRSLSKVLPEDIGAIAYAHLYYDHMQDKLSKAERKELIASIRGHEKAAGIKKDDIDLELDFSKESRLLAEIADHLKQCDLKKISTEDSAQIIGTHYTIELHSLSDQALKELHEDALIMAHVMAETPNFNEATLARGMNPIVRNRAVDIFELIKDEVDKRAARAELPYASEADAVSRLGNIPPEDFLDLFEQIQKVGDDYRFKIEMETYMVANSPYNFVRFTEDDKKGHQEGFDYILGHLKSSAPKVRYAQAKLVEQAIRIYKERLNNAREANNGNPITNKEHLMVLDGMHSRIHRFIAELNAAEMKAQGFANMSKKPMPPIINSARTAGEAAALVKARESEEVKPKQKPAVAAKPVRAFPEVGAKKTIVVHAEPVIDEEVIVKKKPAVVKQQAQTTPLGAEKKAHNELVDYLVNEIILKQDRAMLKADQRKEPVDLLRARIAVSSYLEARKNTQRWTIENEQIFARMGTIIADNGPTAAADLRALNSESDRVTGELTIAKTQETDAKNKLRQYLFNQAITNADIVINKILTHAQLIEEGEKLMAEQQLRAATNKEAVQLPYKARV